MTYPPSVNKLSLSISDTDLPHPLLVEEARKAIEADDVANFASRVRERERQMLTGVINATGVLLHTNLGRSPHGGEYDPGFSNLELSLATGKRGSRQAAVGDSVASLVGSEAAMVVNNGASAVLLALAALGTDKGVAVSRGELVKIGGGFRVPDVMSQSGARLVEVGTTNRTRLSDYRNAIDTGDAAIAMSIHQSNYQIVGFTEATSIEELSTLGVPVIADIGSGLIDASTPWLSGPPPSWLANEPAAKQTLANGADLIIFSGDKLFGSAQAGILAGKSDLIAKCAAHPLARVVRPGSIVLQAVQETTLAYLRRDGGSIPFWQMATTTLDDLARRANGYPPKYAAIEIDSVPGGGTLPGVKIPSLGIGVPGNHLARLRSLDVPIVARVEDSETIFDLRTIRTCEDDHVIAAINDLEAR